MSKALTEPDEIEARSPADVARQIDNLKAALRPLAGIPFERFFANSGRDDLIIRHWEAGIVEEVMPGHSITTGDVRRARAALDS